jgi:23S rRNA (adenine2030-N6)-methyltransferase
MNYRHAFHAGNFADVFKHAVMARILVHLGRKEQPFRVIDTHAGAALYDLDADAAVRTGEWRDGIGRLRENALEPALADWLPRICRRSRPPIRPGASIPARR